MVVRSESEASLREWSKRVLKTLREESPTRGGEPAGGASIVGNLGKLHDAPDFTFKDPHAARVLTEMLPRQDLYAAGDELRMLSPGRRISPANSKNVVRPSKPRASKKESLFSNPVEPPEDEEKEDYDHMVAEAGYSHTLLRTADISMHVPFLEMIRCQKVLYSNPKGDINDVLATNARHEEGMSWDAVKAGIEAMPWLRVYRPDYFAFAGGYPDLSQQFDLLLVQIVSNVFTDAELECLYDMFMQYSIWRIDREVVDRGDMASCVYWVGMAPDPEIVAYCDEQVENYRLTAGKEQSYSADGKVVYGVEDFFRWMASFRLKFLEMWNMRANMPIPVVKLVEDHFKTFDTTGDGLKTVDVFKMLGALGKQPISTDDQKRVITYIKKSDVDGGGTIDYFEFLMLLRMMIEDVARIKSRREQRVIRHTGFTPIQVDALREAFDAADPKNERALGLAQMKQVFENLLGPKRGVTLDRNQMTQLSEIVKESTKKCRESIGRPKYGEDTQLLQMTVEDETSVDLGEFCYVMKEAQKKMPEEVRTVIKEMLDGGKSGLPQWLSRRNPCPDELRCRWEVSLLDRYITQFYRDLLGNKYVPSPPPNPFETQKMTKWTASKVPPEKLATSADAPTWDLLDGSAQIWK